jgi:hypothetical protein
LPERKRKSKKVFDFGTLQLLPVMHDLSQILGLRVVQRLQVVLLDGVVQGVLQVCDLVSIGLKPFIFFVSDPEEK